MKKKDIPQDPSVLDKFTKEVSYVTDDDGKYTTGLSRGWEVKASALDVSWENIKARISEARDKVMQGKASPVLFFMELRIMDIPTLAAYTGYWRWTIKRHFKPGPFRRMSVNRLKKYAEVFEIRMEDLQNFETNPEIGETYLKELKKSSK